jgi:hypothetical protein
MPITRIPEQYRPGLAKVKSMDNIAYAELMTALSNLPVIAGFAQFCARLTTRVKSLSRAEISNITRALFSLAPSLADSETPIDATVSELVDAMRASGREDLKLTHDEEGEFKSRIIELLSNDSLNLSAKASLVRIEQPKVFCDAKILTDMRPIFRQPNAKPIGSVINHTLKIEYHEDGDHREFYVALDAQDLSKLKGVLERAETKAGSLRSFLKEGDLPDLNGF